MRGFEESAFQPCPADAWFLASDSLGADPYDRRAWVTWSPDARRGFEWPEAARGPLGDLRYYVEWRGTVVGPGNYGHMGISAFEFRVDSVLVVRAAQSSDCSQRRDSRGEASPSKET